jgi:hypothetical protein
MSSSSASIVPSATLPSPSSGVANLSDGAVQRLVDQVAGFNLYAIPDSSGQQSNGRTITGFTLNEALHRFQIELQPPSVKAGVQAKNVVGEQSGRLDLRWSVIPDDFVALPGREPPAIRLDFSRSQRFSMQEMTFRFGDGEDGFRSFGTGRTFPSMVGQQPRLTAAATGNVTEGFGKFRGREGNFTLCGDINESGFRGHIAVRIVDFDGNLRTHEELPAISAIPDPDPQTTCLMWGAQKGNGPDQENSVSLDPSGQVRGLNIPTELKLLQMDFAATKYFQGKDFQIGEVIGREIGFGRAAIANASPTGTALSPFLFEGVAKYSFFDGNERAIGAVTTNVLEGRRFDMKLQGAPQAPALRFGFFGPIVQGFGCFHGVHGIFYGVTGSVFNPPPGQHVITHFYFARVSDPEGKLRAAASAGGWY